VLEIYWIDVEGGGATLVVTPSRQSILIDAGEDRDRDASRIFDVASKHAGLKEIDIFVATHWHADHYGGAMRLDKLIPLRQIYDHGHRPASLYEDPSVPQLMPRYKKLAEGKSKTLEAGDAIPLRNGPGGTVLLECVASNRKVAAARVSAKSSNPVCQSKPAVKPDDTDNANSLAFKLTYGKFTFYDGGDLTRDIEEKLVCPQNLLGRIDMYQTDSHGMDVSNNAVLLDTLRPRVVIVNNGPRKGAERDTMKTILATPGVENVWQVHRNIQTSDNLNTANKFIANVKENCEAQFLKAVVRADGSFSMQAGPSGSKRSYRPLALIYQ
jgi:beta-lactamase superfamily II metal-dependent hydrolase